jgi:hypothetical protein
MLAYVVVSCPVALQPQLGPRQPPHCRGFEITLRHTHTQPVGLLWTSDRPVAETSTRQHTTLARDRHLCPPAGFEPVIPTSERPQTHALDRAATGIGGIYSHFQILTHSTKSVVNILANLSHAALVFLCCNQQWDSLVQHLPRSQVFTNRTGSSVRPRAGLKSVKEKAGFGAVSPYGT